MQIKIFSAPKLHEALAKVRQGYGPDAIIMDTVLPESDGIELTNLLANDPATSKIPIMILSSNADLNEVQRAYAAGAKDYLVIPYNPTVLEQKLGKLLEDVTRV